MHASRYAHAPPPQTLASGRYVLGELLGRGGMAAVYRAFDRRARQRRAIKLLLPSAPRRERVQHRFWREARTMAALRHPNIVGVLDAGEEEEHIYFVMELCQDGTVAHRVQRLGPRPPEEALRYVCQVLDGLDHVHRAGLVHRDVKPHNMLLFGADTVKLGDFGIAMATSNAPRTRITGDGDTLGTLAYMAPEQRVDPRAVDARADLYGVGATLYMLVTGRRPFDLAMAGLDPKVYGRLPAPMRTLVRHATAYNPSNRFHTAREMATAAHEAWERLVPEVRQSAASKA